MTRSAQEAAQRRRQQAPRSDFWCFWAQPVAMAQKPSQECSLGFVIPVVFGYKSTKVSWEYSLGKLRASGPLLQVTSCNAALAWGNGMGIPGNKKKLWKINGTSNLSEILVYSSPGPRRASRRTFQPQPSSGTHFPAKRGCSQFQPMAWALGADGWMCETAEVTNITAELRQKHREFSICHINASLCS